MCKNRSMPEKLTIVSSNKNKPLRRSATDMYKLEVFFDYACPFCLRGHGYLKELHPSYPQIEIVWRPCEAHPRPESHGPHTDLCIQGMLFAMDHGADIWAYHDRMFEAAQKDRIDIEDIGALAESLRGLLDAGALRESLQNGEYAQAVEEGNRYAYDQSGVWAVPSYRMDGRKLDSAEGIGITKQQLEAFMDTAKQA
jgi:predicted DsbA family dithiol-disulfide isomerase